MLERTQQAKPVPSKRSAAQEKLQKETGPESELFTRLLTHVGSIGTPRCETATIEDRILATPNNGHAGPHLIPDRIVKQIQCAWRLGMDMPIRSRSAVLLTCTLLLLTEVLSAQLGGQYPPGQYPPTYPGDYPYPSNRYPQRIPGGPTIGIPIPEIKLPKRGGKKEDNKKDAENRPEPSVQTRTAAGAEQLRAVAGIMRSLSDRELLIEVEHSGVFRFRLLTKSRFQDAKGEPMRDSLIKPGDVISAQFNPIDEETIVVVQLVKAGTPEQRAAAAKPVDPATVKVPEGLVSQPVQMAEASLRDAPASRDPDRPILQRRADPQDVSETVMPKSDKLIELAREQAAGINESLPNFLVRQNTTRSYSFTTPPVWQAQDVVTADVAYVNGTEEYRNINVNGRPATRDVQKTGSWSTGEFATTLQDILSPLTGAAFTFRTTQMVGGREATVYDLMVPRSRSHWRIIGPDGKAYIPSYKGAIWIDQQTSHVLRVEQYSVSVPSDCPYDTASWIVEYDAVKIDGGKYMLPVKAETGSCAKSGGCSRNEVIFTNYRKFSAESQIKYDFVASRTTEAAAIGVAARN
ncbi:MAG: hypothetical protein H7039_09270 [Bryobacteraceae bacterium]|nr:hypothetical protein [Bryobacteraceae bacterium]